MNASTYLCVYACVLIVLFCRCVRSLVSSSIRGMVAHALAYTNMHNTCAYMFMYIFVYICVRPYMCVDGRVTAHNIGAKRTRDRPAIAWLRTMICLVFRVVIILLP